MQVHSIQHNTTLPPPPTPTTPKPKIIIIITPPQTSSGCPKLNTETANMCVFDMKHPFSLCRLYRK